MANCKMLHVIKKMKIKQITIESESKGAIIGGKEFINDNSDIFVELENGEKYVATFFTYQNIEWLRKKKSDHR